MVEDPLSGTIIIFVVAFEQQLLPWVAQQGLVVRNSAAG